MPRMRFGEVIHDAYQIEQLQRCIKGPCSLPIRWIHRKFYCVKPIQSKMSRSVR